MRVLCCVTLLLIGSFIGCLSDDGDAPAPVTPAAPPSSEAPAEDMPSEGGSGTKEGEPAGAADTEPATSGDAEPPAEQVKAAVGVGKKGRSLDGYDEGVEGVIAGPAKAYFGFREKAIFQIQIPQAMQFYKAANGSNPKSHDEFMSKIIEANSIKLPELNAGQKYVYDPDKGELMVERPK